MTASRKAKNAASNSLLARLPLRARITAWVVLIAGILQVTIFLVLLLYMQQGVLFDLQQRMEMIAEAASSKIENSEAVETGEIRGIASVENGFSSIVVQRLPSGEVLASTGGYADTFTQNDFSNLPAIESTLRSVGVPNLGEWRLYSQSYESPEIGPYLVTVAVSESRLDRSIVNFSRAFLLSLPIALVSVGIATWIVSSIAVRPIHQLEEFAANLNPSTIGQPLKISDISSEMYALRQQLQSAMSRLERAYDEQGRFLANVSHELKTPISVIRAEAEVLLMRRSRPHEMDQFVRSTADEMKRLGNMVESFLLLTRMEKSDSRIRQNTVEVNELIMEVVQQCDPMSRERGIALLPHLSEDEDPPVVRGSLDLLDTAVGNIVRNAIIYSGENDTVEIFCSTTDDEVHIEVIDQGPRVPEELIPTLFQPYSQASRSSNPGERITGLGLQIAMGIAELHQGSIRVQNLDHGCSFMLRLPRKMSDEAVEE